MDGRKVTLEVAIEMIRGQYPDCEVIDTGLGSLVFIPPADGRYGSLALEVPSYLPMVANLDERALCQESLMRMEGSTRALPDIGKQTLDALNLRQLVRGTIWAQEQLETFMRFGIMDQTDRLSKVSSSYRGGSLKWFHRSLQLMYR